jgi:uncharacterized cofD-like protein
MSRIARPADMTRVTVIGGGTGSFNILSGLRDYNDIWTESIVTMMDSGGDSGRLRDEFGVLPPGDMRRCLVALSEETRLLRDLFSFRFEDAPLKGRSFGNLFFLALTKILDSEKKAVDAISRILKIRGQVIAVTWDNAHLYAELYDGSIIAGEANIDVPKHDPNVPIKRVYLAPEARANPEAVRSIRESDFVVLASGNLYTSTVPNLLVKGIPEAIEEARAPLIYVLNLMTRHGETTGYTASDHVAQIVRYGWRVPDAVVVHEQTIPESLACKYRIEDAQQVRVDEDKLLEMGVRRVKYGAVMSSSSLVRHDPERTAEVLVELFSELRRKEHATTKEATTRQSRDKVGTTRLRDSGTTRSRGKSAEMQAKKNT